MKQFCSTSTERSSTATSIMWRHGTKSFTDNGLAIAKDTIHGQIGKGADMLVPTLLPGADRRTAEHLGRAEGEIYKSRFRDHVKPFPSARELLMRTRDAGKRIVLATSASRTDLDFYIELLDANDLVSEVTCADDVEHTKPAGDVFSAALKKLHDVSAEEAIVVGDTPYDIEAAARCRVPASALRSGKCSDSMLRQAGAVAVYDHVEALLAHFDKSPTYDGQAADAPGAGENHGNLCERSFLSAAGSRWEHCCTAQRSGLSPQI